MNSNRNTAMLTEWKTADGATIPIAELSDLHLLAAITILQEYHALKIRGYVSKTFYVRAVLSRDNAIVTLKSLTTSASNSPFYRPLVSEAQRRGITGWERLPTLPQYCQRRLAELGLSWSPKRAAVRRVLTNVESLGFPLHRTFLWDLCSNCHDTCAADANHMRSRC